MPVDGQNRPTRFDTPQANGTMTSTSKQPTSKRRRRRQPRPNLPIAVLLSACAAVISSTSYEYVAAAQEQTAASTVGQSQDTAVEASDGAGADAGGGGVVAGQNAVDHRAKQQQQQQQQQPVFGAVKHDGAAAVQTNSEKSHAAFVKPGDAAKTAATAAAAAASSMGLPKLNATVEPPQGYYLAAHVVTDPRDGLSYFASVELSSSSSSLDANDRHLEIPYLDCGYSGSTTQAIPLKSGHFRHLPPGIHPQAWTTATSTRSPGAALLSTLISGGGDSSEAPSGGHRKDPQLLVVLKPLELTVSGNGGEARRFQAGDCVLLEDTVGKGHKLSPVDGEELSVLMLALPRHHHAHHHHYHHQPKEDSQIPPLDREDKMDAQTGVFRPPIPLATTNSNRHLSVLGLRRRGIKKGRLPRPCRTPLSPSLSGDAAAGGTGSDSAANVLSDGESVAAAILGDGFLSRRRAFIGTVGFGLSAFTAYFLGQVAPWALGLMGLITAFVGGTVVFDGLIGAVSAEVGELVQKIKDGSALIDDDEDKKDDADDGDISTT